jgi:hypothetical protein
VTATLPVLSTVTVCAGLVLPDAQLPKASGFGPALTLRTTATEVPDSATGALVTEALPVIPTDPVDVVPTAAAVYCTLIVHAAPAPSEVPQLGAPAGKIPAADLANAPVGGVMVSVAIAAPPLFTTVRSRVTTVPVATWPKASGEGLTETTACPLTLPG